MTNRPNSVPPNSDQGNKEIALRRIKRICSSGLPLYPLARALFELQGDAVPPWREPGIAGRPRFWHRAKLLKIDRSASATVRDAVRIYQCSIKVDIQVVVYTERRAAVG